MAVYDSTDVDPTKAGDAHGGDRAFNAAAIGALWNQLPNVGAVGHLDRTVTDEMSGRNRRR
jgi:hypothetical protein